MTTRLWRTEFAVPGSASDDIGALIAAECGIGVEVVDADTVLPGQTPPADGQALIRLFSDTPPEAWLCDVEARLDLARCAPATPLEVVIEDGDDWAHAWKRYFKPLALSPRCHVTPSWLDVPTLAADAVNLVLDPGMAFGTGQHATTSLCTQEIDKLLAVEAVPRALDVGCGTGILAMFAKALGAEDVVAFDYDPEAVKATAENAERNNIQLQSLLCDPVVDPLCLVPLGTFDLVVANVLAAPLIALAHTLVPTLNPGGHLVLSGLLATQAEQVVEAYTRAGLTSTPRIEQDGEWIAVIFRR